MKKINHLCLNRHKTIIIILMVIVIMLMFQKQRFQIKEINVCNYVEKSIDNNRIDHNLDRYKKQYVCQEISPSEVKGRVTVSMTTIPPRFDYLDNLNYLSLKYNVMINIPKNYKFFDSYKNPRGSSSYTINYCGKDYGPGTKLMGLCNNINAVDDIIIYLDDDIQYDLDKLDKISRFVKEGYVIGGNGGFFTDIDDPFFSFVTYTYMMLRYGQSACFIKSDALMGFSGVGIHKKDLIKVCNSPLLHRYYNTPECYFIDDDWLGRLFHETGLTMLSNPELISSKIVDLSEKDGWSNRNLYHRSRYSCFKYPFFGQGMANVNIKTVFIPENNLHPELEYVLIKQKIRENHYNFVNKFGHKYSLTTEKHLPEAHWEKIYIWRNFINTCSVEDILFYSDYDFLFMSNNFPMWKSGSVIFNYGCGFDNNMVMVGNFFSKCDPSLSEFIDHWLQVTKLSHELKIGNDDQISFNLIREELGGRLQIEDFYRYDNCEFKVGVLGIHFPGGGKFTRIENFLSKHGL
jgi:hypothetical protein